MLSRECTFRICEYTSTKDNDVEPALCENFVVKIRRLNVMKRSC